MAVGRREPGFGPIDVIEETAADDTADVDPSTEVVIDIGFAQAVASAQLHQAIHSFHKAGSKPVRMFADRAGGGHRARLRTDETYVSLQLSVLLATLLVRFHDTQWSK